MEWTLRLIETGFDGQSRSNDVMAISRHDGLGHSGASWLSWRRLDRPEANQEADDSGRRLAYDPTPDIRFFTLRTLTREMPHLDSDFISTQPR